jgi:hypothetical protein
MTTKEELKALLTKYPVPANHTVYQEICLGVSLEEFWVKNLSDDATVGSAYYHAHKGDL